MTRMSGNPKKIVVMFDDRSWVMRGPDIQIDIQQTYYPHGWNGGMGKYNEPGEMIEMKVRAWDIEELHGFREKEYYSPRPIPAIPAPKQTNKRTCNWCNADITAIPEDSSNCCYCGGPLNEDSEPEGATKPAPEAERETPLMLEAHKEEDKSEDYLPQVADEAVESLGSQIMEIFGIDPKPIDEDVLQSILDKKKMTYIIDDDYDLEKNRIPFGRIDPKTGKYIPDVYGDKS